MYKRQPYLLIAISLTVLVRLLHQKPRADHCQYPDTRISVSYTHLDIEKKQQNLFFFWYKPEVREKIIWMLRKMNRTDLIRKIFNK